MGGRQRAPGLRARGLRRLGIALVAYSPLGRGFLTGRYRSTDDLAWLDRNVGEAAGDRYADMGTVNR